MLGWLTFSGLVLVLAILADDWYANRHRRPLSHMKPDPKVIKNTLGMEEQDITRANRLIERNKK